MVPGFLRGSSIKTDFIEFCCVDSSLSFQSSVHHRCQSRSRVLVPLMYRNTFCISTRKEKKALSSCSLTAKSIKNFILFFLIIISDFVHLFLPCIYYKKQLSLNLSSSLEFPNSVFSDIGYIHSTILIV